MEPATALDPAESPAPLPAIFTRWFAGRGWTPRPHQLELLAKAREGRSVLLIAPTGGGKTLAGFLPTLVELHEAAARTAPAGLHRARSAPFARPPHPLHLAAESAGGRHRAQPGNSGQGNGLGRAAGNPHRRHAGLQTPAPAPLSARHSAHHAGATCAAARVRRRALSFQFAAPRGARRIAFAGDVQARRSTVARSRAAVRAGAANHHRRPVGNGGRARRPCPLSGAATCGPRGARRSGRGASRRAAAGHDARHRKSICPGPAIRRATRSAKSTS